MIAAATQNSLLLGLLDTLSAVRQAVNWGRLRASPTKPREDHHSFVEHEAIVAAIADRDMSRAAQAMRTHLQSVERNLSAAPRRKTERARKPGPEECRACASALVDQQVEPCVAVDDGDQAIGVHIHVVGLGAGVPGDRLGDEMPRLRHGSSGSEMSTTRSPPENQAQ